MADVNHEGLTALIHLGRMLADEHDRATFLEGRVQRYKEHIEVLAQVGHDNAPDPTKHKDRGTDFRACHNPGCQRTVAILRDELDLRELIKY